jgi:hypothetical protein
MHAPPLRVARAGFLRSLTAGVAGLLAFLAIDGPCVAQSSRIGGADAAGEFGNAIAHERAEPGAPAAWPMADFMADLMADVMADGIADRMVDTTRRIAGIAGLPGWAEVFYIGGAGRQGLIGAEWPVARAGLWRASIGLQIGPFIEPSIRPSFASDRINTFGMGAGPESRMGEAVVPSPFGTLMSPIATSHPSWPRYTELTLASRDVLVAGDRLTLQAGSDLHFVLQEMGMASWASDAAAMIGWRTHVQLRWSRPSAFGEFSLQARVDRRADQLGRGQVEMRWQGHL